jgi:hypothetical protein
MWSCLFQAESLIPAAMYRLIKDKLGATRVIM